MKEVKGLSEEAQIIESILFLENDSVSLEKLVKLTGFTELAIGDAVADIRQFYEGHSHGIEISEQYNTYQFLPKKHLWPALKEHYGKRIDRRLTRAALETLSIIAYSQPITRKEIESIRGVSSDSILRILKEKDFIFTSGHKDSPGRPSLYSTTPKFLKNFNLKSISSLPRLSDVDEERFSDYEEE